MDPRMDVAAAQSVVIGLVATPLGEFGAVLSPAGLSRLTFPTEPFGLCEAWAQRWFGGFERSFERPADEPRLAALSARLNGYLTRSLVDLSVPLDLRGTPFQRRVWRALLDIPYGETRSYADVAAAIGRPGAVRAVGLANGANPVPLIVPCHRVVGRDGTLTGYGGGLPLKQRLLELEGVRTIRVRRAVPAPAGYQDRLPL
jgi:O-6-methylguanine DNA methyltransferase